MICSEGDTVRMTYGDYGVPLPISVNAACADCMDGLLAEDELRLTVARGNRVFLARRTTLGAVEDDGGTWVVSLTKDETEMMRPGWYRWYVALVRDGVVRNTLLGPAIWEVR